MSRYDTYQLSDYKIVDINIKEGAFIMKNASFLVFARKKDAHPWLKSAHLGEAKVGTFSQKTQKWCTAVWKTPKCRSTKHG